MSTNIFRMTALLACFSGMLLFGQVNREPWFRHLNIDNGLSHNIVYSICQDSSGYYWLGTEDGLNRFDGYSVKVYSAHPSRKGSISGNTITRVYVDRNGRLWVGIQDFGLNLYDPVHDLFIPYHADSIGLRSPGILDIYQDTDMNIWVATQGGLELFDQNLDKIRSIPFNELQFTDSTTSSSAIFRIFEDHDQHLWLATYQGLNKYDKKTGRFNHFMPAGKAGINDGMNWVKDISEGWGKKLWVACRGGLMVFDPVSETFRNGFELLGIEEVDNGKGLNRVEFDAQGNIWFASWNGASMYDPGSKTHTFLEKNDSNPFSYPQGSTIELFADDHGNVWLGTWNRGASYYNHAIHKFGMISRSHSPESLTGDIVRAVVTDRENNIWLGIDQGGINVMDRETGNFTYYMSNEEDPYSLVHDNVRMLLYEKEENLMWVGTQGGLDRLDIETGRCTHYLSSPTEANSLVTNDIRFLAKDIFNNLWVGTYSGLSYFNRKEKTFTNYTHNPEDTTSLSDNRIYAILEDSDQTVWIGTRSGLNRFHPEKGTFDRFFENPEDPDALQSNFITALFEDSRKRLWVGTYGGGLHLANRTDETFTPVTNRHGLPNNVIYGILEDDAGKLWFSTNRGLCCYDPETSECVKYDRGDGLQSNQFYFNAYWKSGSGELLFGGVRGLNIFYPKEIQKNTSAPKINLTGFRLFNEPVSIGAAEDGNTILRQHINHTDSITLRHEQSVFTIEFVAIHLGQPEKNTYAYRLEGLETQWNHVGQQRSATYTNLDAGNYTFRVKAANSDQVWTENDRILHVTILPPWWETTWFRILLASLVVLISYLLFLLIRNREQLKTDLRLERIQAEKERELDAMKLKFYSNISHEFRTPLTLILGPLDQLMKDIPVKERSAGQLEIIQKNAKRLLRLTNQFLDLSRIENGYMKLSVARDDIIQFTSIVSRSFDYRAENLGIRFRCSYEPDAWLCWFDHDKIEKILYNLLSNAFKFTPRQGTIALFVQIRKMGEHDEPLQSDYVFMQVSDTGKGIEPSEQEKIFERFYKDEHKSGAGSGIGLTLAKQLSEIHKGTIQLESTPGKGSLFTIRIPISRNVYTENEIGSADHPRETAIDMLSPDEEPVQQEESWPAGKINSTGDLPRILVIDDHPDIRDYLAGNLKDEYQVLTAGNGREGVEATAEYSPDLILCDVMMPGMDGFGFCEKIRTSDSLRHIPIILLTAKSGVENRVRGLEAGAEDYIVKPFYIEEVKLKIRNILQGRESLRNRSTRVVSLSPKKVEITPPEELFLEKIMEIIEKHMDDADFTIEKFASEIGTSRMQLYRKIQTYTGKAAKEFIRDIRLERAAQLLQEKVYTVSEIAYMVGFREISYFRKCFKHKYGLTPTEYVRKSAM